MTESHILVFLTQFALILGTSQILGIFFKKIKQPVFTAYIITGILFGPTVLGKFFPGLHTLLFPNNIIQVTMLETIAWIGIFFLLLETGLEINFSSIWHQKGKAIKLSIVDILVPFFISLIPVLFLPSQYLLNTNQRLLFSVFIATIMTISALPVAIHALKDLNLLKSEMGFLIISALSINDIIGWIIFSIVFSLFASQALALTPILVLIVATLGFTFFMLAFFRRISNKIIKRINKSFQGQTGLTLSFVCLIGIIGGIITTKIGIHSLFGFFIAGLAVGESSNLSVKDRNVISKIVYVLFIPIFFASIGLKIDFIKQMDIFLVLFFTVIGVLSRFVGAWLGSLWAQVPRSNRSLIAVSHIPGGAMHIVVASMAFENKLITESVYLAIIVSAILSSILMGPWISIIMRRRQSINLPHLLNEHQPLVFDDTSKIEVIKKLSAASAKTCGILDEVIIQQVMDREACISSAVEEGIAFPHARIKGLKKTIIRYGRSQKGIEWDSPDGKKITLVFLILTPDENNDSQVKILASLSRFLSVNENRKSLATNINKKAIGKLKKMNRK